MNAKMAVKLTILGTLILTLFQCLRGHDFLTGLSLVLLALWAAATITYALIGRRRGSGPNNGGLPPSAPMPIPPSHPRPPELSATATRR
jgi:hypothetical protein